MYDKFKGSCPTTAGGQSVDCGSSGIHISASAGIAILVVILAICFGSLFFIMCFLLVRRRRREALLRRQQEREDNKNAMEQQDSDHVIVILPDESIACGKIPGVEGSETESPEIDGDPSNEDRSDRQP